MTTQTSTTEEARARADEVRQTAAGQAGRVAGTAKEQVQDLAGDTVGRAKDVAGELRSQVGREAGQQRDRLIGTIRQFADEVEEMAGTRDGGPAAQAAQFVATRVRDVADSIEGNSAQDLAESVRDFARRRPATFLASAALAGVVVGRLTRGVAAASSDGNGNGTPGRHAGNGYPRPAVPTTVTTPAAATPTIEPTPTIESTGPAGRLDVDRPLGGVRTTDPTPGSTSVWATPADPETRP